MSWAAVEQLEQVAQLLTALGPYRARVTEELDFTKLAIECNTAQIREFVQVSNFLKNLGQEKSKLSMLLDLDRLVQKALRLGPYDIAGLTMLIAQLEEEDQSKLIREVDWVSLCLKCPVHIDLLNALGACLENLWKQAEITSSKSSIEKVAQHLQANAAKIKQEIGKAHTRLYSGVAKFLYNYNQVDHQLAKQMAAEIISQLAETFAVKPAWYHGAASMINALYAIDPSLAASFVENNKVRGRIQLSINTHDWSQSEEGLSHLIGAFYRSAPKLWKRTVSNKWITVDLSSLDLDLIYSSVDKQKDSIPS